MSEYKKEGTSIVRVMSLNPRQLGQYKRNANRRIRQFLYQRFVITFQARGYNPAYEKNNWRRYRKFMKVPILFKTREEAEAYWEAHGFANMQHERKVSSSIESIWLRKK